MLLKFGLIKSGCEFAVTRFVAKRLMADLQSTPGSEASLGINSMAALMPVVPIALQLDFCRRACECKAAPARSARVQSKNLA